MFSRRRAPARKTTFAIFSGYGMSIQTFTDMVTQMSALSPQWIKPESMEEFISEYALWSEKHRANIIMSVYQDNDPNDSPKGPYTSGAYSSLTSFFVPTRFIDYTDESQLEDAENAPFAQETEKDKATLANFLRRVQDRGGVQLDSTKFKFRWVKDYHPYYSISKGVWIPKPHRARKTNFAIFSGYGMSIQIFTDMVIQMSALSPQWMKPESMEEFISEYALWSEKHRANIIMPVYQDNDPNDSPKGPYTPGAYSSLTSFFVPTRFLDYTDESQLEDAENAPFAQETEKDKATLANFLRRVQDRGGVQLDSTKFKFRWIRDYHPYYSLKDGTWSG